LNRRATRRNGGRRTGSSGWPGSRARRARRGAGGPGNGAGPTSSGRCGVSPEVEAEQQVGVPQVELAVGHHRVGPALVVLRSPAPG
jgi:hypothetical protein